ncbi:MAG TPA: P-loop NTPase [Candidatus Dormibacteraeota bacterium]
MKIAVSGKGGTGKTTIAATLARSIARRGQRVLAIDCDSNPNLATSLGLADDVAQRMRPMPKRALDDGRTVSDLIAEYGVDSPDGVELVLAARVEEAGAGCTCGSHSTVRGLLAEIVSKQADVTVVDMEAGLEHLSRSGGTLKYVDHLMIVVEPYVKSTQTAYRTVALARDLGIPRISVLASKVRGDEELAAITRVCRETDLELIGVIPYDDAVRLADRDGAAPMDVTPDSPVVRAVNTLADRLLLTTSISVPRGPAPKLEAV